jgi:hypothetical protein
MIAAVGFKNAYVSQREIYDERYEVGDYDRRSHVHVLAAEREALCHAVARAIASDPDARTISLFDFGYGTGRVTNEFIEKFVAKYGAGRDLRVIAYDVSSAGLEKACGRLCSAGFVRDGPMTWNPAATTGYIAGSISKTMSGVTITVVFVHGHEAQHPKVMRALALQANGGRRCLVTTSWYSGIGHIPGNRLRREYFRQLGRLTARRGEMVISVSATGDLTELQPEFAERLKTGQTEGFPLSEPGDLVYETEIGQSNFYHVFSTELNDHIRAATQTTNLTAGTTNGPTTGACSRPTAPRAVAPGPRWTSRSSTPSPPSAARTGLSAWRPRPPRPTEKPAHGRAGPIS